jgi:hypothetical protein
VLILLAAVCAVESVLLLSAWLQRSRAGAATEAVRAEMISYMDSTQRLTLFPGTNVLFGEGKDGTISLSQGGGEPFSRTFSPDGPGSRVLTGFDISNVYHLDVSETVFPAGMGVNRRRRVSAVVRDLAAQIRASYGPAMVPSMDASPLFSGPLSAWVLIRFRHGVTVVTGAYVEALGSKGKPDAIADEIRITIARSQRIDLSLPGCHRSVGDE